MCTLISPQHSQYHLSLKAYNSSCIPELALEVVEDRGALGFTGASDAWSEGFPFRVNELIAHLHEN